MKKSAIAVAVAAALGTSAVALAETTLYGSARVSVDFNQPDTANDLVGLAYYPNFNSNKQTIPDNNKYMDVFNDASRLGVRGSEDLGSGISAIYQFEFGVDVPGGDNYWNSNRPRWVGLKGGFGALTLGTQFTPYYNVIGYTDTFNSTKTFNRDYFLTGNMTMDNPVFFQKGIAELRRGNSVVYTTPNWGGFSAQGMVKLDGRAGANFVDVWEANVTYQNGPWFAGAAFLQNRDMVYGQYGASYSHHDDQYGVAVGWDNKQFGVGFSWQQYNPDEKIKAKNAFLALGDYNPVTNTFSNIYALGGQVYERTNAYTLQGQFYFGSEVLRLTGSYIKPSDGDTKVYTVEAGFQHNLSKRTRLWLEYIYNKQEYDHGNIPVYDPNANVGGYFSPDLNDSNMHTVSAGIRHDF